MDWRDSNQVTCVSAWSLRRLYNDHLSYLRLVCVRECVPACLCALQLRVEISHVNFVVEEELEVGL
jgi:hypothetical protein